MPAPLDGLVGNSDARIVLADARRIDYEVAGAAAAELAVPLTRIRQTLDALVAAGHIGSVHARPMMEAVDAAAKIAMQGRLLAKVASGSVRHSNEQVGLDKIVNQLLNLRLVLLQQQRIALQRNIRPVTVIIDKDLATALIDAALDWALEPGRALEVSLEIKDWPAHGLLRLRTSQIVFASGQAEDPNPEKLSWHLVTEIGRAIGATIDRVKSPGETLLMIEFPRTVREFEGLTSMEVELGIPSAIGSSSRVLAGHSALIITSDVRLREEAKRVCLEMGLVVDNVPSSLLAAQRCEAERPDVILIDERFNDERFEQLRVSLTRKQANLPLIEIAYGHSETQAIVGWGSDKMTRVSRAELSSQLPQALALEMSKIL